MLLSTAGRTTFGGPVPETFTDELMR